MRQPVGDDGTAFCEEHDNGRWKFFKASKTAVANSTLDCCLAACFADVAPAFSTASFHATCCLSCNMQSCMPDFTTREMAVIRHAEIQKMTETVQQPRRVMI